MPGPRMRAAVGYDPAGSVHRGLRRRPRRLPAERHLDLRLRPSKTWRQLFPPRRPQAAPRHRVAGCRTANVWRWRGARPTCRSSSTSGGRQPAQRRVDVRRPPKDVVADQRRAKTKTGDAAADLPDSHLPTGGRRRRRRPGATPVPVATRSTGTAPTWLMRIAGEAERRRWPRSACRPAQRTYFTVVEGIRSAVVRRRAARTDGRAVAAWLADLKPNTWTAVPKAPCPRPSGDWGTGGLRPRPRPMVPLDRRPHGRPGVDRQHLPSGHQPLEHPVRGRVLRQRHRLQRPARLHEPHVPELRLRPRLQEACLHRRWPARASTTPTAASSSRGSTSRSASTRTSRRRSARRRAWSAGPGVLGDSRHGRADMEEAARRPASCPGPSTATRTPSPTIRGATCLWIMAADGYQKMNGQVWRYDMQTGRGRAMDPAASRRSA